MYYKQILVDLKHDINTYVPWQEVGVQQVAALLLKGENIAQVFPGTPCIIAISKCKHILYSFLYSLGVTLQYISLSDGPIMKKS